MAQRITTNWHCPYCGEVVSSGSMHNCQMYTFVRTAGNAIEAVRDANAVGDVKAARRYVAQLASTAQAWLDALEEGENHEGNTISIHQ